MTGENRSPAALAGAREADIRTQLNGAENIAAIHISQYRRNWLCRRHGLAQQVARIVADIAFGA